MLKNAIDWASRPPFGSPLTGKPVAIVGASTGLSGTRRAQQQVRDALSFPGADVLEDGLAVTEAYEKFEDDELTDEATREQLREVVEELTDTVRLAHPIAATLAA